MQILTISGLTILAVIAIYHSTEIITKFFDFSFIGEFLGIFYKKTSTIHRKIDPSFLRHFPTYIQKNLAAMMSHNIFSRGYLIPFYEIVNYYNKKYLFVMLSFIFVVALIERLGWGQTQFNLLGSIILFLASGLINLSHIRAGKIYFWDYRIKRKQFFVIIALVFLYFFFKII